MRLGFLVRLGRCFFIVAPEPVQRINPLLPVLGRLRFRRGFARLVRFHFGCGLLLLGCCFFVVTAEPFQRVQPTLPVLGRFGRLRLGGGARLGDFRFHLRCGRLRIGHRDRQRCGLAHGHDFRFWCGRFRLGFFSGRLNDHDVSRLRLGLGFFRLDLGDRRIRFHLLIWLRLDLGNRFWFRFGLDLGDQFRLGLGDRFGFGFGFGLEIFLEAVDELFDLGIRIRHDGEITAVSLQGFWVLLQFLLYNRQIKQCCRVISVQVDCFFEMLGSRSNILLLPGTGTESVLRMGVVRYFTETFYRITSAFGS